MQTVLKGVGLGLRAEIAGDLVRDPHAVDFLEVVAESCYVSAQATREAEAMAELVPVVPHGVKLSIGSADGIEPERARRLRDLATRLRSPFVSEHVCFVRAGGLELGHLTPLPRTRQAVDTVAANVGVARRELGELPLMLENVATTFSFPFDEASEGDFYAEIVQRTGCDLLFDVANAYANAVNAGLDPIAEALRFPLERVGMIHLAGGVMEHGYYLDDHAHPVPEAVFGVLEAVLARCGDVPILIERDASFPPFDELVGEVVRVRAVHPPRAPMSPITRAAVPEAPSSLQFIESAAARSFVGPDATANELSLLPRDIARTRGILTAKRADEALPLLPTLAALGDARTLALAVVAHTPRAHSMAGIVDAFRIGARALDDRILCEAASRDLLALDARFSVDRSGVPSVRTGPFVGRRRVGATTLFAVKAPGATARVRIFAAPKLSRSLRAVTPSLDLPGSVRSSLDGLVASLKAELGASLSCVIVFGSAARGRYRAGESDVDVCVVLKDTSADVLRKASNPLVLARNAARIEAVVLRDDEIGRAADAFPVFYDDIKRAHVVLFGDDPFASLVIAKEHKRVRVEQELREAQIRLRRAVIDGLFAERPLRGAVTRKLRQIRSPLHALFELLEQPSADEIEPLVGLAEKRWDLALGALLDPHAKADDAHAALVSLLDRSIDEVDRLGGAS